jgi:hypothetical protein
MPVRNGGAMGGRPEQLVPDFAALQPAGMTFDPTGLFSTSAVTWHAFLHYANEDQGPRGCSSGSNLSDDRITLTLWPAVSTPVDYFFTTNVESLRRLLRRADLPSAVRESFENGLLNAMSASLPAVEISEKTLTQIGYFVD